MKTAALRWGALLLTAMAGFGAPNSHAGDPVIIKTALVTPEGSTWTKTLRQMAAAIGEQTGGQVQMKIYAGGVSGDEADVLRKMRAGRLHAAGFSGVGLGIIVPSIRLLEAPLLFRNEAEVDHVTAERFEVYAQAFERKGYILLGFAESGFVYLFSRQRPSSVEGLQQIKMWVWKGDSVAERFLSGLNTKTFPLHLSDVNTGLETGMIDGFYAPPLAAIAFQWHTRVGFMMDAPIVNATGALLMSKRVFGRIPDDHRQVILQLARQHCRRLVEQTRRENAEAVTVLQQAGIEVVGPDTQLRQMMQRVAEQTRTGSIPKLYSQAQYESVAALLAAYRQAESTPAPQ
jgi:TRAP-type C4-dicarboxylate transport system substrate-binding protein